MMAAAEPMLHMMAVDNDFEVDISSDAAVCNDANLARYQVFVQLQEAPFDMSVEQQGALQRFIERGNGWVGIHAAGLTGRGFHAGAPYWQWFEDFLGGIVYSPHPAYQKGTLIIEDRAHPIMRHLPAKMVVEDEWYEFDHSPRAPGVHVLARADESTYKQNKPMGDHPMIWVNEKYRRMVYIAIGHDAHLCADPDYLMLLRNAILWAAESATPPRFRVVAMAEPNGIHAPYVAAAKKWLNERAIADHFSIDYIENADRIDEDFLSRYDVFIQLDHPPYRWDPTAKAAFEKFITQGKIGWIGFHHASLLGEFDGYPMWKWFSEFLGGIRWKAYIKDFAAATVKIEDAAHPIMRGVPASFWIKVEEWYTWDKNPRPNVHVIATVDESTYTPDSKIKMGDHPVIWSNDRVAARNVYIFMGHSPVLFEVEEYKTIFRNAILWAARQAEP
jgi:type 1 glutamine amidotransferase